MRGDLHARLAVWHETDPRRRRRRRGSDRPRVAQPQPISQSPSRIEPGCGSRASTSRSARRPRRSIASASGWTMACRSASVMVSLTRRNSTGSMLELDRELVHRAFKRVDVGHHRRRAHEARRVAVGVHDVDVGLHRSRRRRAVRCPRRLRRNKDPAARLLPSLRG